MAENAKKPYEAPDAIRIDDHEYSRWMDNFFVTVPGIDKLCAMLKTKFVDQGTQLERLREENKRLKSEQYKDEELAKMREEVDKLHKDITRSFYISESEWARAEEWCKKHNLTHNKPRKGFKYEFTPTCVGTFGKVVCQECGESFTFQEP